jgi:hypothetical protein
VNALPEYNHSRWSLGGLLFLMPLINNSPDNLSFFSMRAEDSGVQNSGNRGKAEKFGRRIEGTLSRLHVVLLHPLDEYSACRFFLRVFRLQLSGNSALARLRGHYRIFCLLTIQV